MNLLEQNGQNGVSVSFSHRTECVKLMNVSVQALETSKTSEKLHYESSKYLLKLFFEEKIIFRCKSVNKIVYFRFRQTFLRDTNGDL